MKRPVVAVLSVLLMPFMSYAEGGSVISGGLRAPKAIQVSLESPGNGIDRAAEGKLLKLINTNLRNRHLSMLTTKVIGFEGDVQYCLEFQSFEIFQKVAKEIYEIKVGAKLMTSTAAETCLVEQK